eukprot:gb/GECG01009304.1/.p1 GENE.gb/GECG01009304.1/~~gb/GECG01009304.1/.p1  ORF type:complete len:749 (+),score=115.81 gb/GECG01009304.1/:1-2247(+)
MPPKKATAPKRGANRVRESRRTAVASPSDTGIQNSQSSSSSRQESSASQRGIRTANTSEGRDLDKALEANRKFQAELYQLYLQLEERKREIGHALAEVIYESTSEDVFFGADEHSFTNEPRQLPHSRLRNLPLASRYRRSVGEQFFVDHNGKAPTPNIVAKAREHIRRQLPPNFGSTLIWKPTDDALLREGVNSIGRKLEQQPANGAPDEDDAAASGADEEASEEEEENYRPRGPKKYNQPKDLLQIRSSTSFRKLRKETERINSTYIPDDIDKVDWKQIARKYLPRMTPQDCKVRWCYNLDPKINREPWTRDEIEKLTKIVNQDDRNLCSWEHVAEQLGTDRHPFDCLKQYNKKECKANSKWSDEEEQKLKEIVEQYLAGYPTLGENFLARVRKDKGASDVATLRMAGMQTAHEAVASAPGRSGLLHARGDALLTFCGAKGGAPPGVGIDADLDQDWTLIADHLPLKPSSEARRRWTQIADPCIDRSKFSEEEDRKVLLLNKVYGNSWSGTAKHLPNRTGQQVREHFENVVNPHRNTKGWTEEEDQALIAAVGVIGRNHWTGVARHMKENGGFVRDDAQCLKRFTSLRYQNPQLQHVGLRPTGQGSSGRGAATQPTNRFRPVEPTTMNFEAATFSAPEVSLESLQNASASSSSGGRTNRKRASKKSSRRSRKQSSSTEFTDQSGDTATSAARVASELARKENVRYVDSSELGGGSGSQSSAHLKRRARSSTEIPGVGVKLSKSRRKK